MTSKNGTVDSRSKPQSFCVGIPAYNEAHSIGTLLQALLSDTSIGKIIVVDDSSTDDTAKIVEQFAERDNRVLLIVNQHRGGQVSAWLRCAGECDAKTMVFIDADSNPEAGSVMTLAAAATDTVIASGRVRPLPELGGRGGRFSAEILHRLRAHSPALAIIGRFFAVNRRWFLDVCDRTDIIANDMWLACLASQSGSHPQYVDNAVIRYIAPADGSDFAAQRQRSNAGARQLKQMGLLNSALLPSKLDAIAAVLSTAWRNPRDAISWAYSQLVSLFFQHYKVPQGAHAGIWEPQQSTKINA